MEYTKSECKLGKPSYTLDGDEEDRNRAYHIEQISTLIANAVGIDKPKVNYFISNFGVETVFKNPSIMGITKEQKELIEALEKIILYGGESDGASDDVKPIRY